MRTRKLVAIAGSIAALSVGLAACGDDDEGGGDSGGDPGATIDLTVGALIPQTGDLSIFAPAGEKAANLAVEEIQGALEAADSDSTVELVVGDTETKPQAARQAAESLISDGASCLAGAWASGSTIPVGQAVASRQQVPLISPASTSQEITDLPDDGYVFRTAPSDTLQAQLLADLATEKFGSDATISVAGRNDSYGEGFVSSFVDAYEEGGGTINGPILYDVEAATYDSEAADITADSPDGYVIIDFPDPYGKVGQALVRTGEFDAANLFVADGLASDTIPDEIPGDALNGAEGTRPGTPEGTEAATAFDQLYKDSSMGPKARGTFDAQNFDAVAVCALAAIAAGSTDGEAIKDQLSSITDEPGEAYTLEQFDEAVTALQNGEEINYEGVSGPIAFDENGDPTAATYEQFTYSNGKLEVEEQVEASEEEG